MRTENQTELVRDEMKTEPKTDPISKPRIELARLNSLVGTTLPKFSGYATVTKASKY